MVNFPRTRGHLGDDVSRLNFNGSKSGSKIMLRSNYFEGVYYI